MGAVLGGNEVGGHINNTIALIGLIFINVLAPNFEAPRLWYNLKGLAEFFFFFLYVR